MSLAVDRHLFVVLGPPETWLVASGSLELWSAP